MANNRKPDELKAKLGSKPGVALATITLMPVSEIPEPPRPLLQSGLDMWHRAWTIEKTWISSRTDIDFLTIVCEQMDERDILRAYVLDNIEAWHERSALRELEKTIQKNLSLLFFTPADRQKAGLTEVKAKTKLEEIIAKRQARE